MCNRTYHVLVFLLLVSNLASQLCFGAELDAAAIRGEPRDKVVGVVQNRYFTKSWRPNVALMSGRLLEEAFTKTSYTGARLSLFPNEWVGIELQTMNTSVSDSPDRTAINRLKYCKIDADCTNPQTAILVSPDPEVNRVSKMTEYSLIGVPFYGKINIANLFLVYSDIYTVLGIGRMVTEQGEKKSLVWGLGQRFYLNQFFNIQYDFRQRRWNELRGGKNSLHTVWCLDIGIGAFLWK